MAKDPAVLWYWNDWNGGTVTLSRFLKGCYMDLLHAQFNNGNLSIEEIKTVLGSDFGSSWPTLQKKFKKDDNGLYYNERLVFESSKRQNYSDSRKKNRNSQQHMSPHMEDENENKNEIEFIDINLKQKFVEFLNFRSEIKKPVAEASMQALKKKVLKLANNNEQTAIEVINQSIENGWQGLFELKNSEKKENGNKQFTNKTADTISGINEMLAERGINPNDYIQQPNSY